jgi:4-alpha-glucanotransferase
VPAGEKRPSTAIGKCGPGDHFFTRLQQVFGRLPFVAEDLGDVDDTAFALRDKFNLPRMTVLHFVFGNNSAESLYIPHNYIPNFIVYTGKHDTHTTRGWYKNDLRQDDRKRLTMYCSKKISERNVAEGLIRLAYCFTANRMIIPLQNILNLDKRGPMNNLQKQKAMGHGCLNPDNSISVIRKTITNGLMPTEDRVIINDYFSSRRHAP